MGLFSHRLLTYLQRDVIQGAFDRFMALLEREAATHLDTLIEAHDNYLAEISSKSMATGHPLVLERLSEVLRTIGDFCSQLEHGEGLLEVEAAAPEILLRFERNLEAFVGSLTHRDHADLLVELRS